MPKRKDLKDNIERLKSEISECKKKRDAANSLNEVEHYNMLLDTHRKMLEEYKNQLRNS